MTGPKLNARSYAILILAAIALVVGGKLIAQDAGSGSQYQANTEIAAATRDVAAATREVAAANLQIAEALKMLATSIDNTNKNGSDAANTAPATASTTAGGVQPVAVGGNSAPEALVTPAPVKGTGGVFEMDKK